MPKNEKIQKLLEEIRKLEIVLEEERSNCPHRNKEFISHFITSMICCSDCGKYLPDCTRFFVESRYRTWQGENGLD
jgi:hypothetical protein